MNQTTARARSQSRTGARGGRDGGAGTEGTRMTARGDVATRTTTTTTTGRRERAGVRWMTRTKVGLREVGAAPMRMMTSNLPVAVAGSRTTMTIRGRVGGDLMTTMMTGPGE